MEEQSPTEPTRRRPEPKPTRRSGPINAAFASPDAEAETTDPPPAPPRPRARKTPPTVLFQPPAEPESQPPAHPTSRPAKPSGTVEQPDPVTPAPATGRTGQDIPTMARPPHQETSENPPAAPDPASGRVDAAGDVAPQPEDASLTGGEAAGRSVAASAKAPGKKAGPAKKATAGKAGPAQKTTAKKTTAEKAAAKESTPRKTAAKKTAGATATGAATAKPSEATAPVPSTAAAPQVSTPSAAAGTRGPGELAETRVTASEYSATSDAEASTIRQLFDHPGYAPELLALAAVRSLGPEARSWAAWVRAAYPNATHQGLVRLATRRYVRLAAAGGALSTTTGLLAPFTELATVIWAQAGLVLHLAAAHALDPTRPDRAADLLVLLRVHPDLPSARVAIAAAEAAIAVHPDDQPNVAPVEADGETSPAGGRLAEAGWRLGAPMVARSVNWLMLRLAVRRLPGAMALAAAMLSSADTERLAARAVEYYRSAPGHRVGGDRAVARAEQPGYSQSNQSRGSSA
ncbi:hypothetical protein O7626_35270 [Micromonospora sp. WMMD1102]|uniref:hypothetical protein n=1 Tax=Micromonospora sp. WMMD1102 TaxID=3016105 RepID=UPI002414D267|nr:hypothetical protein [Micromonospora sp. WMMD1102]MDG4791109.1 hypothetical protein [Micromonospora sp. WMMD1102]